MSPYKLAEIEKKDELAELLKRLEEGCSPSEPLQESNIEKKDNECVQNQSQSLMQVGIHSNENNSGDPSHCCCYYMCFGTFESKRNHSTNV